MTLPSAKMSTPEPVSVKLVKPLAPTSRPRALMTTTDGFTLRKTSPTLWAWAGTATQS